MIIFGTRTKIKESQNGQSLNLTCEHCQQQNTLKSMLQFSYLHIFWIPVFPYSKKYATECSHCKNYRAGKEVNQGDLEKIKLNTDLKIPRGYYIGLILILLPIVFALSAGILGAIRG